MQVHSVKPEKKSGERAKEDQLAWKIAELAAHAHEVEPDPDVTEMVKNRLIDNAAIAMAAVNEKAVAVARDKAMASRGTGGATIYGVSGPNATFNPRDAAFANAVAVRFRDQDDTYLAAEYAHPDDNISPLLAVAQQMDVSGQDLIRGIAAAYEVHVALAGTGEGTGISLHKHKVDHMTHIAAATAAGMGAMLAPKLKEERGLTDEEVTEITYHAINFAVHNAISSRQSRKGDIGAQKEFVPGISAEAAIDGFNAALQGLKGPNPVYEGEDSIIAQFLKGRDHSVIGKFADALIKQIETPFPEAAEFIKGLLPPEPEYKVALAEPGKDKLRNILRTYPKEHAFEYQGQAIIDLSLDLRKELPHKTDDAEAVDFDQIKSIKLETSHHTHHVIGTGTEDKDKKIDPYSMRGTLDHSIMFAIARSLQLGAWDERVYDIPKPAPGQTQDPEETAELRKAMAKVETALDPEWERRYHSTDPRDQAFGGKMIITLTDGTVIERARAYANAHANINAEDPEKHPWGRLEYLRKFDKLTTGLVNEEERGRFLGDIEKLETLPEGGLRGLTTRLQPEQELSVPEVTGIYGAWREQRGVGAAAR